VKTRQDIFLRYWVQQLLTHDCDSSIFMMKYVIQRMELNIEQQFWFCWIYANTYHLPTAWVIFNEFPDYENAPLHRISDWSFANRARLPYQKDQKWLRGRLGETFSSYQEFVGEDSQRVAFQRRLEGCDPQVGFHVLWDHILKHFYKFGRYTAWFYLQVLKEVTALPIEATSLMLEFDASATHRAGLCYALGQDHWASRGQKFTPEMLAFLDAGAERLLTRAAQLPLLPTLPVRPDYFSMETACCSFKKLFRREQGRYLGFYLDRQAEDIEKTAAMNWPGINWQLLWDARNECVHPELLHSKVDKSKFSMFLDTMEFMHDCPLKTELDLWCDENSI